MGEHFILNCSKIVKDHRGARASAIIHKIFDGIFEDKPDNIQCQLGCNFCCYSRVEITDTELSELALHIRRTFSKNDMISLELRCKEIKKEHQKMTSEDRMMSRTLCPLNSDGACTVYEARPLFCRSAFSSDKQKCESAHDDASIEVPMPKKPREIATDMTVGILLGEDKKEYSMSIVQGLIKEFKF